MTKIDTSKVEDIELDGIDTSDSPDFSDAYILSATYEGKPMTAEQLDELSDDAEFVYEQVMKHLY